VDTSVSNKKILYAALDWGMGHLTRSIGIIRDLLIQNNEIVIACNSDQKEIFLSYFPNIKCIFLEGYNFKFSGNGNWSLDLWKQRKSFFKSIKHEHDFVRKTCLSEQYDLIISDHRYGFFSRDIESVFITHQVNLPLVKLYFFVQNWHKKQLKKFSQIWVLDDENSSLAGALSTKIQGLNLKYIGWKSRFIKEELKTNKYDYLIVVSGPKPYSEQFIDEVENKLDFSQKRVAVIYPNSIKLFNKNQNWNYFSSSNLKANDMLFYESEIIISRSGYSTLMDLKVLNKKSILIPTKGQKEQEYLFNLHFNE
jgi:spore coat polysaccharide biosynthesis predicted glycosyltransferase SpsG